MNTSILLARKIVLYMALVLQSSLLQSQSAKLSNTLLWEISGNGLNKPSYLFGTMHVSNKIAFHLQDSFFIAISNVDRIALEINPENWLRDMIESKTVSGIQKFSYKGLYKSSDIYTRLVNINFPGPQQYKQAFVDNNQLINQLLYRMSSNPFINNYEERTYVDLYIYQTGKKLNKKITGLENFDESMSMMMKAMIPDENMPERNFSFANFGEIQDKLEKAYRRGNLNELDSLSKLLNPSANFQKYLIVERNKIMVNSMDSLMKISPLFTGVGAAHLPGKEGIINLLVQRGYTVKPVTSKETNAGKKTREKLENKNYVNETYNYFSNDSSFRYSLPEKLIDAGYPNSIYTDMANGCFFSVYRIPHYAYLLNKNEHYISLQLDSILYESVPGKIVTKKTIVSNNGFNGSKLITKLPNGTVMQYQIYYTPLEVIVFKAGGTEKSLKLQEWDKFFETITFNDKSNGNLWRRINPGNIEFTIEVPALCSIDQKVNGTDKDIQIQSFDPADSAFYMATAYSIEDYNYLEDDTFEYNYIAEKLVSEIHATLLCSNYVQTEMGRSMDVTYSLKDRKLKSRILLDGNRYYLLSACVKDTTNWLRFFNSFKINNQNFSKTYALVDSSLQFKTLAFDSTENDENSVIESFSEMFKGIPKYQNLFSEFIKNKSKSYTSKYYPSAIEVSVRKIDEYASFPSADSLWNSEKSSLQTVSGILSGNYVTVPKSGQFAEKIQLPASDIKYFQLKDSFSKQSVIVKKIFKNDHIYTLSTVVDSSKGMDPWQKLFYENFDPWDTCKHFDIYREKASEFWSDLASGDSARFAEAITSKSYTTKVIKNNPFLVDSIFHFIEKKEFKSMSNSDKIGVINLLEEIKLSKELHFRNMEDIYKHESENSGVQIAVLQILANQKTVKATEYLKSWMLSNTPLTDDEDKLTELFDSLAHNLDLCKPLYPDILKLTKFEEYKQPVLQLFADLIIHKKINAANWASAKNDLLSEAQNELKRYNSENASKNDISYLNEISYYNSDIQKITSAIPWKDNRGPGSLACFTVAFASQYSTDNDSKKFIDKVFKTGHRGLIYSAALSQYRTGQTVNDTIWNWLASNNNSRMHFYDWLEVTKDTSLYPRKYYNQKDMCISWLMEVASNINEDSIQFIEKRFVKNVYDSGYMYFYKYKAKNKNKWYLNYVGLQPADTTKMLSDFYYMKYGGIALPENPEAKISEHINDICKTARLKGRNRVENKYSRYEDSDFDEE